MAEQNMVVEVVASWGANPLDSVIVSDRLVVGPGEGSWLALPSEVLPSAVTLVERVGDGFVLRAPDGARMIVRGATAVEGELALTRGMSAEVRVGDFSFYVRPTEAVAERAARGAGGWRWTRWLAVAAVLHGIVLALFAMSPPNVAALNADNLGASTRYVTVALPAVATPPAPPSPTAPSGGSRSDSAGSEGGGEAAIPQEAGSPGETRPHGARNPRPAFVVTRENLSQLGPLAMLTPEAMSWGDGRSPYIVGSGVDGEGGLANGRILAMPRGPGFGALDMGGTGVGTCDPRRENCDRGFVGVGELDTHGDPRPGHTVALNGERPRRVPPRIHTPIADTTGGLSREEVRRTIRRHVNEVRFCYEQALQSRPDLEGRVAVRFIIAADGTVQAAEVASNTVAEPVGSCVQQAVRRWTFPSSSMPTGVTYPFVMQSGR